MLDPDIIRDRVKNGDSSAKLAKEFSTTLYAMRKFVADNDLGPWVSRTINLAKGPKSIKAPIPDDFATLAKTMTQYALQRHYGRGWSTVSQWYADTGVERLETISNRVPDNFVELVATKTIKDIATELGCGRDAVRRMIKEAGLYKPRVLSPTVKRAKRPAVANIIPFRQNSGPVPTPLHYERDMSRLGLAVEYLKTLGPVSRDGDGWKRGNTRMSSAEIIERADEIRERDARRRTNPVGTLRYYGS